jgi:hypothetical protein
VKRGTTQSTRTPYPLFFWYVGYISRAAILFSLGTFSSVTVYIDHLMHLGPSGNQVGARAIAKSLEDHPGK